MGSPIIRGVECSAELLSLVRSTKAIEDICIQRYRRAEMVDERVWKSFCERRY
jgi:hypothetical protein